MKFAKPSPADMAMAMELSNALDALSSNWGPQLPSAITAADKAAAGVAFDTTHFSIDDPAHCRLVFQFLLKLTRSASISRVIFGMAAVLHPPHRIVDPHSDTLEPYRTYSVCDTNAVEPAASKALLPVQIQAQYLSRQFRTECDDEDGEAKFAAGVRWAEQMHRIAQPAVTCGTANGDPA